MTQIIALQHPITGEIVYSRTSHDCVYFSDKSGFVDGGQTGLVRRGGDGNLIMIELPVTLADLYNDWNLGEDNFGRILPKAAKSVRIIPKEEYEDRDSEEYRLNSRIWLTNGKTGKDPSKAIMLVDADTDHLKAILATQSHLSKQVRDDIKTILKRRDKKDRHLE